MLSMFCSVKILSLASNHLASICNNDVIFTVWFCHWMSSVRRIIIIYCLISSSLNRLSDFWTERIFFCNTILFKQNEFIFFRYKSIKFANWNIQLKLNNFVVKLCLNKTVFMHIAIRGGVYWIWFFFKNAHTKWYPLALWMRKKPITLCMRLLNCSMFHNLLWLFSNSLPFIQFGVFNSLQPIEWYRNSV